MAPPNIPAAKRAGLPVDLDRLTAEGDDWLSPEDRYALKTHGVCTQAQPGVFMIRVRTDGGRLGSDRARGLADLAERHGRGWVHLTTRQQVELHHVRAEEVTAVLDGLAGLGLSTRSACGHTVRGVMSCPDAGVSLDEPFDCGPDAAAVSAWLLSRAAELNVALPSRLNISFGGCPACRDHAKLNDAGFVSVLGPGGEPGYELLLGGSLGKSVPALARTAVAFLPRADVLPAVDALVSLFVAEGDHDRPGKARLKFLVARMGWERFAAAVAAELAAARRRPHSQPAPVTTPLSASLIEVLGRSPAGGWGIGVRPQRLAGRALVTVNVPLGDLDGEDLRALADLADAAGDEHLHLTRNQNVLLRHVAVEAVAGVRDHLAALGLGLEGADSAMDVRACTGGPVCALAITPAPAAGAALLRSRALARNAGLRVHVSGCPNACAQHQVADIGFSGGKVTVRGESVLGYQVWLGGDLGADAIGSVAGRIAAPDLPAITAAVIGVWEALRERGETLAATVARLGLDAFRAHIDAVFAGRWEQGPEPEDAPLPGPAAALARAS